MSGRPSLLLIGTGFVAGSVLTELLKEDRYDISATSRKDDHLEKLESIGVKGVKASLDDSDKITEAVYAADIIINGASSDHPGSVDATLKGIERRSAEGKKTIYIHTSGTGVLDDNANGERREATIFTDEKPDQIEGLSDKAPHRAIDKKISRTAEKLKDSASIRIILPPLIFGEGSGPFNQLSIQTPTLLRASLKYKKAGVVGSGSPIWSNVHVIDLARGFVTLLHALEADKLPMSAPYDVYVFCESGDEHSWRDLAEAYGKLLKERGAIDSSEPKSFTPEEIKESSIFVDIPVGDGATWQYQTVGCNSRSRAVKLRKLGWQPREADLYACLPHDVDAVLREGSK